MWKLRLLLPAGDLEHPWAQANCMALYQPLGIRKEILQRLSQYS